MSEENNDSIFSRLKNSLGQGPAPESSTAFQALPVQFSDDGRVTGLEAAVRALQSEIEVLKKGTPPAADAGHAPPPPPPGWVPEFGSRLARAEGFMEELRGRITSGEENAKARSAQAVSKGDLKNVDLRISDISEGFLSLKRTFAGESELAARLESAENGLTEVKTLISTQQALVRRNLDALAPREEINALKVNSAASVAALEEVKHEMARYSEEFSGVEHECRKALGEMQGYVKSAERKPLAEQFDEFLKDSVARMNAKLSEVETAMHAGLSELASRLTANEILYKKIFTEAEDRVKKSVAPELKALEGETKVLRERVAWLTDEYKIVMERKMRALEGKYSAFEAISKRMDSISDELERKIK